MSTRNIVLTDEQAARLEALRRAADQGIADIEAGRYRTFSSADDLREHLNSLVKDVVDKSS